ncbi:hypothetical protein BJV82DRAFT_582861 [Fennellomyces sp. T-0311]|nr:hypothetical protein BJV82DRAFT_582861 [Fennellomyces sp. T-0311]
MSPLPDQALQKKSRASRTGDNVKARLKYGGQVGVDAQKRHSQAFCARLDEKHRPYRARRRALIRAAFSEAGLTIDESSTDVSKFIREGCWNHEAQHVDSIIKKVQAKQATQQRRLDLVQRLQKHNLRIRDGSRLCSTFIDHGEGHIDDIVMLIVEANWFEKYTNYNELRNLCANEAKTNRSVTSKFYKNTELGKMRALREYLTQRLMLGQWDDVSLDADTPKRPPESLWQRIRALTSSVWQEQTRACFLEAGVRQSPEVLLLDPDQASSLTNDLFIRTLHRESWSRPI